MRRGRGSVRLEGEYGGDLTVDVDDEDRIPTLREVIRDELGITIPEDEGAIDSFWKGLAPHLFDLMAVWAMIRVGFRLPDWIGGAAAGMGEFAKEFAKAASSTIEATAAALAPLSRGLTLFTMALPVLRRAENDMKHLGDVIRDPSMDPCEELYRTAMSYPEGTLGRAKFWAMYLACVEDHKRDPTPGAPSARARLRLLREQVEIKLDVIAVAIVTAYTVRYII